MNCIRGWGRLIGILLGTYAAASTATDCFAQALRPGTWGADGNVVATLRYGSTLYIAGAFNSVGPVTGGGVPVNPTSGNPRATYPRVCGTVRAALPDGAGGWYIGGNFNAIGGVPCSNLAHISSLGRLVPWYPNPDGEVDVLAFHGGQLFIGGRFRAIGGLSRDRIAAVDPRTAAVSSFDPGADGSVRALSFTSSALYVGGDFTRFAGLARHGIAKLGGSLAVDSTWNPDANIGGLPAAVNAVATVGDTVYLGGSFYNVGSSVRPCLGAVDAATGAVLDWSPPVTGPNDSYWGTPQVNALAALGGTLLIGGHFTAVSGLARVGVAQVDRFTGSPTAWSPGGNLMGEVRSLLLSGTSVRVGGGFLEIGGQTRNCCGEVDLATGLATAWDPHVNDGVYALAAGPGSIYVGGAFTGAGPEWQPRRCLAALDATTGMLKSWNPSPDGLIVYALAGSHGRVYAAGHFSTIGGQQRLGLAALDTLSGASTDWVANTNDTPTSLALSGDTLLVGGVFTSIGGTSRRYLASIDLNSGAVTGWNPDPNDWVNQVVAENGLAYVGGFFTTIGSGLRNHLAAFSLQTGLLTPWNPNTDSWVNGIAVGAHGIFACGAFQTVAGQPRIGVAELDPLSGAPTSWRADINSSNVYALALLGDTLFVGGEYTMIGGQSRNALASVDGTTGDVLPWNADLGDVNRGIGTLNPVVWSLALDGTTLYAAGFLGRSGAFPISSIAAFDFPPRSPAPGGTASLALSPLWPNPVRAGQSATMRLVLRRPEQVRIDLFSTAGRRVATVLEPVAVPAGIQEFALRTDGLRSGFYFCRVEAGNATATQKFVVLR